MRSAAYSLGYLGRTFSIWQNLFFENRSVDDPLPVFIEKTTSAIRELGSLFRPDGQSAMDPALTVLTRVNAALTKLRRRRKAVREGEVCDLLEASKPVAEELCGVLTADMIGHPLLKEWFRFGCALGAFCRQLSENPKGRIPPAKEVVVTARRIAALDSETPKSIHEVASGNLKQSGERTLAMLHAAISNRPRCHNNLPLDLLYATFALDEDLRESLEWLPVATPDEIPDFGQMRAAPNGREKSDSRTQSPTSGEEQGTHLLTNDESRAGVNPPKDDGGTGDRPWWTAPDKRPPQFVFGPLEGTKRDLARWHCRSGDPRALEKQARNQVVCVVRIHTRFYEIWFKVERNFDLAKKKRDASLGEASSELLRASPLDTASTVASMEAD